MVVVPEVLSEVEVQKIHSVHPVVVALLLLPVEVIVVDGIIALVVDAVVLKVEVKAAQVVEKPAPFFENIPKTRLTTVSSSSSSSSSSSRTVLCMRTGYVGLRTELGLGTPGTDRNSWNCCMR